MKPIKKLLKTAGIIAVSFILFLVLLVTVAKVYEDKLIAFTMEKLETEINAPMSIGKVSLIPLFSFPRLSAEINQFWIGDPKSQNTDTIFFINSLKLSLDSWDLINGIYTINKLEISGLDFDYTIDKNGESNIDFVIDAFVDTIPKTNNKTIETSLDLNVEKLKLKNIKINYYDSLTLTGTEVHIPEINIKAKTKNSDYSGKTEGSFVFSHCHLENTKLNQMELCTVTFALEYKDNEAIINNLSVISEGINLFVEGKLGLEDKLEFDANIDFSTLDFKILKKYFPNRFNPLFEDANTSIMENTRVSLKMEYEDNNADIEKLSLINEGINLSMEGVFKLGDTIIVDANLETFALDFEILKNYIPKKYFKEYGVIDVGGNFDLSAVIKGKYADSTLLPLISADANFINIRLQTNDFPKIDTLNLSLNFTNGKKFNLSEASLKISNLDILSHKSRIHLDGGIGDFENPRYHFSSKLDISLNDFKNFIPDSLVQNLEGNIIASIKTNGIFPKKNTNTVIDSFLEKSTVSINLREVSALLNDSLQVEGINADFSYSPKKSGSKNILVENLSLKSEELNLKLQNSSLSLILSGQYSSPSKMRANIQAFNFQSGENKIIGSGEIKNFEKPEFQIKTNIILNLGDLMVFVPDTLIKEMTGIVKASILSKGIIYPDSLDSQIFPIIFENSSLDFTLNNISLEFTDSLMNIDSISAQIALKNDILKIDDFSAIYNGLKIEIDSSRVKNIYKAVILNQKEELYAKAHIKTSDILFDDFKQFLAFEQTNTDIENSSSTDTVIDTTSRNWTFLIHGSASVNSFVVDSTVIDDFKINRLHINDMSALFKLTDSSYIVDQFKFKVFEGEMNNSMHYKVRDDGTQTVSAHNVTHNMNIRTMLRDMDNFGLDSLITFENISGILSTELNIFFPLDDTILTDKMMVSGDIILEKGGVYNFEPAQQISRFTSIKELDNIQFKTLRSNIFMFKNKLYVPRTNIVSNALDITAYGMQSLDGDSEYHLELHLSNILFGKSKKRNKKQDKSGEEIDEGSLKKNSQKVSYTVKEGKSKVGRDTKEDRDKMKNKIRVQKKMLDFIFFPKNIHYNTEPH